MDELFQENEWKKNGSKINSKIKEFKNLKNYLENAVDEEKSMKKNEKNIKVIENYLIDLKNNIEPLIYQIQEKVKYYQLEESLDEKQNNESNDSQNQDNLLIQDLAKDQEILEERRKQLEEAYETSAQIKDLSEVMVKQLNEQGEILNDVEKNVITAKENAKKAHIEITKADQMSRGNRKKMNCLFIIIFIAFVGITAILLALIF